VGRLTGFAQDEFITLCFVRFSGIGVTLGAAYQYNIAGTQSQSDPAQRNKQCSMYVFRRKQTQRLTTMTPEDRNEMIELVRGLLGKQIPRNSQSGLTI
jgi:urate oxidase